MNRVWDIDVYPGTAKRIVIERMTRRKEREGRAG